MNREEYIRSVTPLTEAEIRDLLGAGLIGNLPKQTVSRIFATLADHAALIAKVREIAITFPHVDGCRSFTRYERRPGVAVVQHDPEKCTCPRGKLLGVINYGCD